jgi:hypothetical protein
MCPLAEWARSQEERHRSHVQSLRTDPTLQAGARDPFPPSRHELLELSAHTFVTHVHLQYQTAGRRANIS